MIRLVDTSAWIEWLIDSPLGKRVADELPKREAWLVPTIAQLELTKWRTRTVGEDRAEQGLAFTQSCVVIDRDTTIALSTADLCARHKLSTADAVVYATARAHNAELLTCDSHFEGLDAIMFFRKVEPTAPQP